MRVKLEGWRARRWGSGNGGVVVVSGEEELTGRNKAREGRKEGMQAGSNVM